ncbi:MAG: TIGR01440 family protein [Clostridiales bacterium]|jgi:uncharacterized protein (TIGR01440 family)|nr:TIGR01440 family protein [Clostridiales bacterium]
MNSEEIRRQASSAIEELLTSTGASKLKPGSIFVVGCSSSEITGGHIGHNSNMEAALAVLDGICPALTSRGIYLAAQCCEHLNRAIVIESEAALSYGLEPVCVRPRREAGGAFATAAYERMASPVVVEFVKAHAGMDIGGTLIGMHLKHVAVPVHLSIRRVGEAVLTCAYTRPKLIGGERAVYK